MRFCSVKKLLISFLLLSYPVLRIFSAEAESPDLQGVFLSSFIEQELKESQFSPQKTELTPTGSNIFAYNISVFLDAKNSSSSRSARTMLVLFSQNDFTANREQIIRLLKTVRSAELDFPVQFVFTALDDRNSALEGYNILLEGTQNFARTLDTPDDYFSVLVSFAENKKHTARIFTTGGKNSTPLWLTKEVVKSFLKNGIRISVPQKFLAIYRAGLLFGDDDMASFFREGVPCIKIELSAAEQFSALTDFILSHSPQETEKNDVHYSFFALGTLTALWFNEFFNIVSLEIFGALVILFLVCFTFTGKKRLRTKRDFSRFWFLIPLMLFFSVFSLYAGQFCCEKITFIKDANPVIQFAAKLFISILLISVAFLFQSKLNLPDTNFLYGFMLILVSTANVFLFSMADITVFWVFALEYLIVYFTRNCSKIWTLCLSALLMLFPFLSYIAVYFANVNSNDIRILISASKGTNILLSLILFPFQIVWLKILVRFNTLNREKSLTFTKIAKFTFFSLAVITVMIGFFTFLMTQFFYSKTHAQNTKPQFIETPAKNIALTLEKTDLPQISVCNVKIASKKQAVRYIFTVSSEKTSPVLDSLYSFTVRENSKISEFNIPDFPPQNISIEFSTEKSIPKILTLTAIYKGEGENVYERETVSTFTGGEESEK